ncbi:hypothetical protein WBQ28_11140 [Pseudomonas syringae pv. syringae]|uniref:TRAFAC clade GTPase domain-containing protein n=1 Tax=Pseudomonas syringae TaxID=317 RepID=UPI003B008689
MATQKLTCDSADCNFASDGKCVEGYEVGECPHTESLSLEDIPEAEESITPLVQPETTIALASGEALDRDDASVLQRRNVSRSIGLIAPNDAGKTSLIAGVFDLFQMGSIAGAQFAGSSTLIGFEKVCHLARVVSQTSVPHTERTSRGAEPTFFHVDVYQEQIGLISVFISDRSGEDYLAANDQISQTEHFFEIRRADCITLLVNGAQLADSKLRHEVKATTPQIVGALIEAGTIRKGCRLAIVLTKKDSVMASTNRERIERDFNGLVASISVDHAASFGEVKSFVIAASPKDTEHVVRGEGVADLLQYWLQPNMPVASIDDGQLPKFERMIDLLADTGVEK